MKRVGTIMASALAALLTATAAHAQPLGFSIDPTSGIRGSTVNGQVNVADVAANCNTTLEQVQAAFVPLLERLSTDPVLCEQIFPGLGDCSLFNIPTPVNYEQFSFFYIALAAFAVTENFSGATEAALPQTFVMTFADLATQAPVGDSGNFDPTTGVGSVVVPDFTPGSYPVVATCVQPNPDLALATILSGADILQENDVPLPEEDPNFDILASVFELGPQMIVPLMAPKAIGLQFFTITNPTLGFTIDPTSGLPGTTVNGQVNPADVAAHCNTTVAQLQAAFNPTYVKMGTDRDLCEQYFPGLFDQHGSCAVFAGDFSIFTNYDQLAYGYLALVMLGIDFNIGGAADSALPQTFVMTFADLLTQAPLGERGNFDPVTGIGSVVVPDLAPGIHPVAATCVAPNVDLLQTALDEAAALLEASGPSLPLAPDFDLFTSVFELGPEMIVPMMTPRALGAQFFTILADVDHFQCYRARTSGFNRLPVTLSDRFGTRSVTVRSPLDLCAPADKNGEDAEAATDPGFLTSYRLSSSGPQQTPGVIAQNQFGSVNLNVLSPKVLMVPTAVSADAPPSSTDGAFLNHFTCYDVRVANGSPAPVPGTVTVKTAFETVQVQPRKPKRLCVPTSKNGEPVIGSSPENLLCYKSKSKGSLNPAPNLFLLNQFGQQTQRLGQRREFCVPTDLVTPPS